MGMFTGYSAKELDSWQVLDETREGRYERIGLWQTIRSRLDFAVMGRYNRLQPSGEPLRTSRNQELRLFTPRYTRNPISANRPLKWPSRLPGWPPLLGFPRSAFPPERFINTNKGAGYGRCLDGEVCA